MNLFKSCRLHQSRCFSFYRVARARVHESIRFIILVCKYSSLDSQSHRVVHRLSNSFPVFHELSIAGNKKFTFKSTDKSLIQSVSQPITRTFTVPHHPLAKEHRSWFSIPDTCWHLWICKFHNKIHFTSFSRSIFAITRIYLTTSHFLRPCYCVAL